MLRSLIHLDLSSAQGDKCGSICILLHAAIQVDQHHLLNSLFSSVYSVAFIRPQASTGMWTLIPVIYIVCFYGNTVLFFTIAPQYNLRSAMTTPPAVWFCFCFNSGLPQLSYLFAAVVGFEGFYLISIFTYEAENYTFKFCEEFCWSFVGDCTESIVV